MTTHTAKYELLQFIERPFFSTILGFTKTEYGVGSYTSEKPVNISGIDKIHVESDFSFVSIVNGIRPPIFYTVALDEPPGHILI